VEGIRSQLFLGGKSAVSEAVVAQRGGAILAPGGQ